MKAIDILEKQIEEAGKNTPVAAVGYLLLQICRESPAAAELVAQDLANESMSITKCYQKLYNHALKKQKQNCYAMLPREAEQLTKEFYGIPAGNDLPKELPALTGGVITLDDLLGEM